MPGFAALSDEEIVAVLAYVMGELNGASTELLVKPDDGRGQGPHPCGTRQAGPGGDLLIRRDLFANPVRAEPFDKHRLNGVMSQQ